MKCLNVELSKDDVRRQIEEFFAKGGEVEKIPQGKGRKLDQNYRWNRSEGDIIQSRIKANA